MTRISLLMILTAKLSILKVFVKNAQKDSILHKGLALRSILTAKNSTTKKSFVLPAIVDTPWKVESALGPIQLEQLLRTVPVSFQECV